MSICAIGVVLKKESFGRFAEKFMIWCKVWSVEGGMVHGKASERHINIRKRD